MIHSRWVDDICKGVSVYRILIQYTLTSLDVGVGVYVILSTHTHTTFG